MNILAAAEFAETRNVDRLLPSQALLTKFFTDVDVGFYSRLESTLHSILPARSIEEKWPHLILPDGMTYASLGSDLNTLNFYQLLIRLGGYRHILEIGTFVGASTLFLAEAVALHGKVTTIEQGDDFYNIAKVNIARSGLKHRIMMRKCDAVAELSRMMADGMKFDFILVDAAKQSYGDMLHCALACLNPGGLLLFDDIFMQGDALNRIPTLDKGQGVRQLLDRVATLPNVSKVILPIGDGLLLIHRS
jgi:predicted O-methyltransferase YrrM